MEARTRLAIRVSGEGSNLQVVLDAFATGLSDWSALSRHDRLLEHRL
jgi:hypothetical protein